LLALQFQCTFFRWNLPCCGGGDHSLDGCAKRFQKYDGSKLKQRKQYPYFRLPLLRKWGVHQATKTGNRKLGHEDYEDTTKEEVRTDEDLGN
jgi:hypothetical protein